MTLLTKDYVYEKIQEKILSGTIPLGSRISEHALSKEFGVSRTPIREALTRLVYEGIAEQVPNDGFFLKRPSLKDIEELYDLRKVLESHTAYRAAQNALPIHLEIMRDALNRLEEEMLCSQSLRTVDERWAFLVRQFEIPFHTALIHAADNARLASVAANMQMLAKTFNCVQYNEKTVSDEAVRDTIELHDRIYQRVKEKDGEGASQVMREHTDNGYRTTLRNFELSQRHRSAERIQVLLK